MLDSTCRTFWWLLYDSIRSYIVCVLLYEITSSLILFLYYKVGSGLIHFFYAELKAEQGSKIRRSSSKDRPTDKVSLWNIVAVVFLVLSVRSVCNV